MTWTTILKNKVEKAPKKTKKASTTTKFKGQKVTQIFKVDFKGAFAKWKRSCVNAGTEKIGTTGATSSNLYEFVQKHVVEEVMRVNSPNSPGDGATQVIKLLETLTDGEIVADEKTIKSLKRALKKLDNVKKDVDLNPANIPFTTPVEVLAGGKAVYPEDPNSFGHYRTKLYNEWAKKKENVGVVPTKGSWISEDRDFSARPPMYQALYGDGQLVSEGLYDVLEKAIQGIDEASNVIVIQQLRDAGALADVPEVKAELATLLKNSMYVDDNGKINFNRMANAFAGIKFPVDSDQKRKYIEQAAGIEELEGEIVAFYVEISGRVLVRVVKAIFGNRLGRMKSGKGHYIYGGGLDYRPRKDGVPVSHPRDIKKSWMDRLWIG